MLVQAFLILMTAKQIYDQNPAPALPGVPSMFDDHSDRLYNAMASEAALTQYLREVSGNPSYRLARPYETIAAEWSAFLQRPSDATGPLHHELRGARWGHDALLRRLPVTTRG